MDVGQATAMVALADRIEGGGRVVAVPERPDEVAIWSGAELHWEALLEVADELGPDPRFRDLDDGELERRVRVQAAELAAATCRWLELIAELVVRGVWAEQGARTPGQWLSWAVGLAPSTAREHVRVGLRLRDLPQIRERFAAGTLSYSKVRALTRVATSELEPMLLCWADNATASKLEQVTQGWRRSRRATREPSQADATRGITQRITEDGWMETIIRTPVEEGVQLHDMLRWLAERAQRAPDDGHDVADGGDTATDHETGEAADSLHCSTGDGPDDEAAVADGALDAPGARPGQAGELLDALLAAVVAAAQNEVDTTGADRHTLVLYAPLADILAADQPTSEPSGTDESTEGRAAVAPSDDRLVPVVGNRGHVPPMSASVLRRLACDAGIVLVATDEHGTPIDVGRRHRYLTAALRRALRLRDRICRFPGCTIRRHLHAHHIVHWTDGGPTDMSNLVLLCGHHHRFVHQHGWTIDTDGKGRFQFAPPGRAPVPPARRLPGASAEAVSDRVAVPPDVGPTALMPGRWDGSPVDIDLAVSVLHQELSLVSRNPALAA